MTAAILEFSDVHYTYHGDWMQRVTAVAGITLAVPEGSSFGFLGANGAGKSTAIKLVMGLLAGHQGDIRLAGTVIGDPDLRRSLGYLPEVPYFYENLRVDEYLAYLGRLSGMDHHAITAGRERVYACLDLGDLARRPLRSFSKGMRQRFGLAQAILHQPRLLILDEPFSGLDPLWRARFRGILVEERRRGATLFFSSHILSDVEDICDHYTVIDHGRILESGRLDFLLAQAPLLLLGAGVPPAGAAVAGDGTWTWGFPEQEREARLAAVAAAGGRILRLERQRQALEDYFVRRVRDFHAAGRPGAVP